MQALEDALRRNRKDISCEFLENSCDGVCLLELKVSIEMPLIPKITETVFLEKTKTLKDPEIVNAKLLDVKKSILKNKEVLGEVTNFFGRKIVKAFDDIHYNSQQR